MPFMILPSFRVGFIAASGSFVAAVVVGSLWAFFMGDGQYPSGAWLLAGAVAGCSATVAVLIALRR